MAVQAATFVVLASCALLVDGAAVLLVVCLALSVATTVGVWHLALRLRTEPQGDRGRLAAAARRAVGGAAAMVVPAWAVTVLVPRWIEGRTGAAVAVLAAAAVGALVFLLLQAWWRSPELAALRGNPAGRPSVRGADR
jgi:hypothetical protein